MHVCRHPAAFLTALGCVVTGPLALAGEVGYYAQPALHDQAVVFVSEGDLWHLDLGGAEAGGPLIARRLTSGDGDEFRPVISPDGQSVAFSAQYDGNTDVYLMPIDGGAPRRLTSHPGPDLAAGWMPDGQTVLFTSPRQHHFGRPELWRVSSLGGPESRFAFGECSMVSLSSTGRRFAFTRWSNENWTWKRYRGGTAPEIWLGDLSAGQFQPLTDDDANDMFPMWLGDRVYFASDRTGTVNIFSDSTAQPGADVKQHTHFAGDASNPVAIEGYDVRWPAADAARNGTRIIFCQGGALALLDLKSDAVTRLDVRMASDRVAARQRYADLSQTITAFGLSRDGKRLLVESRGELLTVPAQGVASGQAAPWAQLTHSSQAREWGACFVGEDQVALITDQSGEHQLAIMPINGSAPPGLITDDREAWLFPTVASPDARFIAFADKTTRLHVFDARTLERRQIDASESGEITDYRFSPDSQWIAYAKPMPNDVSTVWIASVRTGRTFCVSTGLQNDRQPRWDPAGKYLYFLSSRHLNPVMSELDVEHGFINATEVYAVPLAADTPPPLIDAARAAGFDLEQWGKQPKPDKDGEDAKEDDAGDQENVEQDAQPIDPDAPPADAMRIDTDGMASRQFLLPIEPGNHGWLEAVWGGLLYLSTPVQGLMDDPWPARPQPKGTLHRFDLVKGEGKPLTEKIARYVISEDCSTIAHPVLDDQAKVTGFTVMSSEGGGDPTRIAAQEQQIRVEAPAEWAQMFDEAWRLQRDFYWAPNYVGVNWPAMREKYKALLPRIGTRAELNDLIGQLIGELGTSHTYVWGGEPHDKPEAVTVGMLGADFEFDGSGYRIARIIPGQPWGEPEYVSPLEPSYLNVKEGDYVLSVNGRALSVAQGPHDLLQDQAGKVVRLTIAADAFGANSRTVTVRTLPSEQPLRYAAWVQANRRLVEERSKGQIGYVHVPDMSGHGLVMFSRLFYPQYQKPAMIIDERDNGGGFVSEMIIERLARRLLAYAQPRHGHTARYPARALDAHMVMLIDQHAGSDGDIFPTAFKALGLGPLVGTRTWGGVIGIRGDKPFVDMGLSTQPEFAWWEAERGWAVENQGVEPDVEVDITPADRAAGRDPQLDRAIDMLLEKLKSEPRVTPPLPEWPVRVK